MKLLCALLAFLVLTLTAQPPCIAANTTSLHCCSDRYCEDDLEQNEEDSSKNQNGHCTQVCNPFQACGCCAFSIILPAPIIITTSFTIAHTPINWGMKILNINEEPSSSFWQPPKQI